MGSGSAGRRQASGWVTFVGVYLALAGTLNVLWGIAALAEKHGFEEGELIWSTLSTWGWIGLIVGAIQLLGAGLVAAQRVGGPVIAGFLSFLGLLLNFLALGAYPLWSVILLVVNSLILWATTVHSDEFV